MPSLGDSAVIIFLGLLLFGPKGLAQIARQLGKLMGEFRRASTEFRMQMEEELRVSEQADRQKQIAAIEAAAPAPPPVFSVPPGEELEEHPHMRVAPTEMAVNSDAPIEPVAEVAPLPIATSGALNLMPPATGLPSPRGSSPSSLSSLIESVPHVDGPDAADKSNGDFVAALEQKPMRYTNGHGVVPGTETSPHFDAAPAATTEESLHG